MYKLFFCGIIIASFLGCKKETKTPEPQTPSEEPDFILTLQDFQKPQVGTKWSYRISSNYVKVNTINNTIIEQNQIEEEYNVEVAYDTIVLPNYPGVVLKYYNSTQLLPLKELRYYDTLNTSWCIKTISNGGAAAISIKLPLTPTSTWSNIFHPINSTIQGFESNGYENYYIKNLGYLKCIVYKNTGQGSAGQRKYWQHKKYGLIKAVEQTNSSPSIDVISVNNTTLTLLNANF